MCDSHLWTLHPKPSSSIWHSMAHLPIKHITKKTDPLCTVKRNRRFYQYQYLLMILKETRKIQNVTSYCHCCSNSLQTIFLFICQVTTWLPPSALWQTEKDPEPLVRKAVVKRHHTSVTRKNVKVIHGFTWERSTRNQIQESVQNIK